MRNLLIGLTLLASMSSFAANDLNISNARSIEDIKGSIYSVEGEENLHKLQFTHYTEETSLTNYPVLGPLSAHITIKSAASSDAEGLQVVLDEYCSDLIESQEAEAIDIDKELIYIGGQGSTIRGVFDYEFSCN